GDSSALGHAHAQAGARDGAGGAAGGERRAVHATEGDKGVVEGDPEALREARAKDLLRVIGQAGADETKAAGDAVHMGVHADARLFVAHGEDEVGGLAADAGEAEELLHGVGDATGMALDEGAADRVEGAAFDAVEAGRVDEVSDALRWGAREGVGGRGFGEEA